MKWSSHLFARKLGTGLLLASALAAGAHAQTIFVADPNTPGAVRSYNIDGTLLNSSLVSGLNYEGLALSGSSLYVTYAGGTANSGEIKKITLDGTGAVSSSGFFALGGGLNSPWSLAVTSTNVLVADFNTGNLIKYDLVGTQLASFQAGGGFTNPYGIAVSGDTLWVSQATTGAGLNTIHGYSISSFSSTPTFTITANLDLPHGLVVSGNTLYVANGGASGNIWSFDATTGASIGQVVSGLTTPQGVTFYGSSLYVTSADGTVKAFDAATGNPLAGFTTITGLSSPNGIVVGSMSAVPEPSTYAAIAGGIALSLAVYRRRRVRMDVTGAA
jgi:WD40 repeat protein